MPQNPDDIKIQTENDYREVSQVISRKKRPAKILRALMNSLESYRQSKRYGWSRPWNKYDLINFQSFKLNTEKDAQLISSGQQLLASIYPQMPEEARSFTEDLLNDSDHLMGFIFCHEYSQNGEHFEGATLSFGRVYEKRYRDRIDIIMEAKVVDGVSQGYTRTRVYIDPYREGAKEPLWQANLGATELATGESLFALLSSVSWDWAEVPAHHWDHWTSAYIDYFGDRQWPMTKSHFWIAGNAGARISEV